jgi:hypothetical protein
MMTERLMTQSDPPAVAPSPSPWTPPVISKPPAWFFEDLGGAKGAPRLLVGIALAGGDEAVRVATPEDVDRYTGAYQAYYATAARPFIVVPRGWKPQLRKSADSL